ncbi:MAG: GAF domain-containing protein [Candidatus Thermoplasmatota archaeon]
MDYEKSWAKIKSIVDKGQKFNDVSKEIVSFLYDKFEKYSWVGIYLVEKDKLVLNSWRGEQATEHVEIPIGEGICGSAAKSGETEIVKDVRKDDRYISCFISTRSEIVVPIKKNDKVFGEIDIDSDYKDAFNSKDSILLERTADLLSTFFK